MCLARHIKSCVRRVLLLMDNARLNKAEENGLNSEPSPLKSQEENLTTSKIHQLRLVGKSNTVLGRFGFKPTMQILNSADWYHFNLDIAGPVLNLQAWTSVESIGPLAKSPR